VQSIETASATLAEVASTLTQCESALQRLGREHGPNDLTFEEFKVAYRSAIANERSNLSKAQNELNQWRRTCGNTSGAPVVSTDVAAILRTPLQRFLESPWCRSPSLLPPSNGGQADERIRAAWEEFRLGSMRSLAVVCDWLQAAENVQSPEELSSGPFEYSIASAIGSSWETPMQSNPSSQAMEQRSVRSNLAGWSKTRRDEKAATVA
jgi:hypothetical protein